jgi:Mg2+/Co2+ transporter CorB
LIDVPIGVLVAVLIVLIVLSAFFSSSETGMMALNRYRLRHLVKHKHKGALRASRLLERPDRLIGVILLGNNFVNILASSITTVIALRLYGESGIAIATFVLTMVILIFAEVTPKTLAVLYPERVAFPASIILIGLLKIMYPLVATINWFANGLLRTVGVSTSNVDEQQISQDELRTVVNEASSMISRRFKRMLISILDLERVTVDDIMIPRGEINAIDLDDERNEIEEQITHGRNTRLPVYRGDINNVQGILHMRKLLPLIRREGFDVNILPSLCDEPYFVPEGTPLDVQLRNFQRHQQRLGLVVDEYGDVQGLVTLEDLLEEIVGDFTSDPAPMSTGTFLVDAASNIRDLNRSHGFKLPTDGPKTLNGLIIEHLESIPETGTTVLINNYPLEVVQKTDSAVKTVRIAPRLNRS